MAGRTDGKHVITGRLSIARGYSAYEIAVLEGFEGTEEEWLLSLKGTKGDGPCEEPAEKGSCHEGRILADQCEIQGEI